MRSPIALASKGKWRAILQEVGKIDKKFLDGKHHGCPASGEGFDRFRFSDRRGDGNYFCGCSNGTKDGFELLKCCTGKSFAELAKEVEKIVGKIEPEQKTERDKESILSDLRRIKRGLVPETALVSQYLRNRGIELPVPRGIRQGRLNYALSPLGINSKQDAMVAMVRNPAGEVVTFHITYLTPQARKAEFSRAKVVATPAQDMRGGAVRLAEHKGILGVGEGLESSLSAMQMFGLPTWATLSTTGMRNFQWPPDLTELVVFADGDKNYAGQAAAYELAHRASVAKQGPERVTVCVPLMLDDWNDVLQNPEARAHNIDAHWRLQWA